MIHLWNQPNNFLNKVQSIPRAILTFSSVAVLKHTVITNPEPCKVSKWGHTSLFYLPVSISHCRSQCFLSSILFLLSTNSIASPSLSYTHRNCFRCISISSKYLLPSLIILVPRPFQWYIWIQKYKQCQLNTSYSKLVILDFPSFGIIPQTLLPWFIFLYNIEGLYSLSTLFSCLHYQTEKGRNLVWAVTTKMCG